MGFAGHPQRKTVRLECHSALKKGLETGHLIATEEASEPQKGLAGLYIKTKHLLIGHPLPSSGLVHERISKFKALAVFSSDAISSVAYATEEILWVLVAAGAAAMAFNWGISLAIVALIAIVAYSYRQTIHLYPQGGGTYSVTKDNFGNNAALLAGAALMIDYVLTAAVSTSAGVAAVTSAFPAFFPIRVEMALIALLLIMLINLRGVRESATVFAIPTYVFILSMFALIGIGIWRVATGQPPVEVLPQTMPKVTESIAVFLFLRAFASGCAAVTGVEAVSNGVPAFKEPQSRNASTTLIWMALILGCFFLGTAFLAQHYHVLPQSGETVLSQLARTITGRGPFYYLLQAATALILFLAVNTSFADFPRLAGIMAQDRFLPRQFVFRGDRLAYSTGILVLSLCASLLIILVHADVHNLIPLYAVGVFMSFTFSQSGMFKRWMTKREPGWRKGLVINGLGALTTALVTGVILATKFVHGAWMIVVVLPLFVLLFQGIHRHYLSVGRQLSIQQRPVSATPLPPSKTIVLIGSINQSSARILRYAQALSEDVIALHVTDDLSTADCLKEQWKNLGFKAQLVILESPYRSLVSPVLAYLDQIGSDLFETPVTIILSAIVTRRWWENLLHNQDGWRLKAALFVRPNTVVIDFPFHLE